MPGALLDVIELFKDYAPTHKVNQIAPRDPMENEDYIPLLLL